MKFKISTIVKSHFEKKKEVLLIMEGTYPYNTGGVSTWAHSLCQKLDDFDFTLYSINGNFETKLKYNLSDNVKSIIQVPLWSLEEPQSYIHYGKEYYKVVKKKEKTSDTVIAEKFVPIFKRLVVSVLNESYQIAEIDAVFKDMWQFFQHYDYETTMKNKHVWQVFKDVIHDFSIKQQTVHISLQDITIGMRWFFHFLLPISIDIPKKDISHITLSGFPVIPALILNYKYNTPIVVTEHGVYIRERLIAISASDYSYFLKDLLIKFSECITRLVYYKADKILSVNKFNKTWEVMYGADPAKIEVIYNGIDHNEFKPRPKPKHLQDVPTVVAAARIFELKDILTMIKSCAVVKREIPNVKYIIYGNKDAVPEYTEKCEALIIEMELQDNFVLAGFHDQPHLIYSEGDISILTSISEGFPYTVIESMSCGVPVVSTDVGGVTEAIDKSTGFVCKPKDHEDIGEKVIKLLKDEKLRNLMGENSRKKVLENFTIKTFTDAYAHVYKSMTTKKDIRIVGRPKNREVKNHSLT